MNVLACICFAIYALLIVISCIECIEEDCLEVQYQDCVNKMPDELTFETVEFCKLKRTALQCTREVLRNINCLASDSDIKSLEDQLKEDEESYSHTCKEKKKISKREIDCNDYSTEIFKRCKSVDGADKKDCSKLEDIIACYKVFMKEYKCPEDKLSYSRMVYGDYKADYAKAKCSDKVDSEDNGDDSGSVRFSMLYTLTIFLVSTLILIF